MVRKNKGILAFVLAGVFSAQLIQVMPKDIEETKSNSQYVTIDPSTQYQTFDGWGTSLAWWTEMVANWDMKDKNDKEGRSKKDVISELLFDEEKGLGINIVRYNIGGGDNPNKEEHPEHIVRMEAIVPGYKKNENDDYNWDADENQVKILEDAKNILGNEKLIVEIFSNTPPWYMTESGCSSGNIHKNKNNLKDEKYGEFANYLADVTEYIHKVKGVEIDYLEPINEPSTDYWFANSDKQEGCHFDQGESQNRIYKEMDRALREKGLRNDIKITGTDETSIDVQIDSLNKLSKETIDIIDKVNTHAYEGEKRGDLRDLSDTLDKKLWMSEVCVSNADHNHGDITSSLELSDIILKDLRDMKSEAWVVWQAVESEAENWLWNNNYGLIHGMYESKDDLLQDYHVKYGLTAEAMDKEGLEQGSYFITKQYYVFGQYSKFIRPNYKIIDSDNNNVLAAMAPGGDEVVVVAQNTSKKDKEYAFLLDKLNLKENGVKAYRTSATENISEVSDYTVDNNNINMTLPADSITTFVISTEKYNNGISTIVNDNVLGTDNNEFNYSVGWNLNMERGGSYTGNTHSTSVKGSSLEVSFDGTEVQLFGTKNQKGGRFKVYIDNEEKGEYNSYSEFEYENEILYTVKNLEDKDHILKVELIDDNKTLELDSVKIVRGDISSSLTKPIISNVSSWGSRINLAVKEIGGAQKYNVYYGLDGKDYKKQEVTNVKNIKIENVEVDSKYNIYVTAIVDGVETEKSNEVSIETKRVNDSNILYYVDCGDPTVNVLDQLDEEFGVRNSLEDKNFGVDPLSGYKWGYTCTGGSWSNNEHDRFKSIRCDTSNSPKGNITYKFELDNEDYRVILGFADPWNNQTREMDIIIEDEVKEENYITPKNTNDVKTYENVKVEDGFLDIVIQRSEGAINDDQDPQVSWILIEEASNKSIVSVESVEDTVSVVGQYPELPKEISVKYSDGSTGKANIIWDTINKDIISKEYSFTKVNGNIEGSNKTISIGAMMLPKDMLYYIDSGLDETESIFDKVKRNFPIINKTSDQKYENDKWGYLEDNTGIYLDKDSFKSVRYANNSDLTYKLNLEDGKYTVAIGFMDPWGDYGRKSDIYINSTLKEDNIEVSTKQEVKVYENVEVENGLLEVAIKKTEGTKEAPVLSFIMVSPQNEEIMEVPKVPEIPETPNIPETPIVPEIPDSPDLGDRTENNVKSDKINNNKSNLPNTGGNSLILVFVLAIIGTLGGGIFLKKR